MEDHERPMLGPQLTERAIERVPVGKDRKLVVWCRNVAGVAANFDDPPPATASLVDRRVHE